MEIFKLEKDLEKVWEIKTKSGKTGGGGGGEFCSFF